MTFFGATLLSAIATVVLAVLAIVTAGYARRAFLKQSQEVGILLEESERDKADRRMAQAARVFLAADPDAGHLVRPYVKNASDLPVYDARISYTDLHDTADREYLGMIMPSGTRSAAREFSSDLDALDGTSVTFRDAAGVWWTRMPRGELRDESFPAALSGANLAAAFERVTGRRISRRGSTRRLPPAEAPSVASPSPAHRPERLVAGELAAVAASTGTPLAARPRRQLDHLMIRSAATIEQRPCPARTQQPGCIGFLVQSVRRAKPPDRSPALHERKLSTQHTWASWCTPSSDTSRS
jgi:hypothetical protein